jgi:hypothetical protein
MGVFMVSLALARQAPDDLGVSLDSFAQPELAADFFMQLDNLFAVFSPSVKKLYSSYNATLLNTAGKGKIVVVPDFSNFSTIYSHISLDAVSSSSVMVFPGAAHGRDGIYMAGKDKNGKMVASPIHMGIQKVLAGDYQDGAFIPVILMKELQQLPNRPHPCIHLHKLDLNKLLSRSAFDRKSIATLIQKNFFSELAELKKKGIA